VGDVVMLMRSCQWMSEAIISCLDRDEAKASAPPEGPPCAPVEKVKFTKFFGSPEGATAKHGLRKWRCDLHFMTIPPT
jgi:hypothetical protein